MRHYFGLIRWSYLLVLLLASGVVWAGLQGGEYDEYPEQSPDEEAYQYHQGYGDDWRLKEKRRKEILKQIPTNPDILINVTWDLMPGTPELTALGRKATKALTRALLDNAYDNVRSQCAGVLAQIRDPEAAEALVEALKDRNESVRYTSVLALSNLADASHGRHFVRLVEDPEEAHYVKQQALQAIGNVGYDKATRLLIKLIKDEEQTFAWAAASALWHMRNKADRDDLVDVFMFMLKEEKWGASQVVNYLGALRAVEASAPLAKHYVGRDFDEKNRIIIAMGKIGDKKAKAFLKGVMKNTQVARHLNNAAIALNALGEREAAVSILLGLLKDRKAYMRINAAFALGEVNATEKEAVDGLITALDDLNDYVRSEAAVALGRIKAGAATAKLVEIANGDNPFVALDAVIALNRISFKEHRQLIFDKLLVHRKPKFRRIVERGIRFLAEQQDPAALPYLLKYIRSHNTGQYGQALALLAEYKSGDLKDFESSLLYLTHTCSYDCFTSVLRSLRGWKLSQFTDPLMERLYRMYYGSEKTAVYFTLGKIAPKDTATDIGKIKEKSHTAWLYQQFALANLGNAEAVQRLVDIVRDGTLSAKRDAAFLLSGLDSDAAAPKLKELMKTADPFTAVAAASGLLGRGDKQAAEFLYDVMKNGTPIVSDEAERFLLINKNYDIDEFLSKRIAQEKNIVTKRRSEEILYRRSPKEFR